MTMQERNNIYAGRRVVHRCHVTVNTLPLGKRYDLRNHSPDGFEWGYNGSGPSQLALAILAHEYGDSIATKYYKDFREKIVSGFVADKWTLDSGLLDVIMAEIAGIDFDMDSDEAQYAEFNDH